jgi:hypothetical protein
MSKGFRQLLIAILLGLTVFYSAPQANTEQLHVLLSHHGDEVSESHGHDHEHEEACLDEDIANESDQDHSNNDGTHAGSHHCHFVSTVHLNFQASTLELAMAPSETSMNSYFADTVAPLVGISFSQFRPPIS